jgi:two-component system OmpR family sensor kinase/two-component system sensor histidine kinase QseC
VHALVRNLLENALRYSPIGGRIRIETGEQGGEAFIAIDDSGPGIPSAERERVFDPFYRLDSNNIEGCGVGLAIVRSVVKVHHANISLSDSTLGGLRAEVRFPAALLSSPARLRAI